MPRPRSIKKILNPSLKSKVAVYARVSSKEQADEGYSIDAQLGLLRGYAIAKGLQVVAEIVEAETAKSTGRPGFASMVKLAKSGRIGGIVAEKTDRLYRNLRDRVTIDELKIEVHLVKEGTILSADSKSHEKFIHDIKVVLAKNYIDNLAEETKKGMSQKASQGLWPSNAPFGYINVSSGSKRTIEPNTQLAPFIKMVYELYATGNLSLKELSNAAYSNGLRGAKGQKLGPSHLHVILRNPIYAGVVKWNGQEFPGLHQPLVEASLWRLVQSKLDERSLGAVQVNDTTKFIYKGLLKCSRCGCNITAQIKKQKYVYYHCTGSRGCDRLGAREEDITATVATILKGLKIKPNMVAALQKAIIESSDQQVVDQRQEQAQLQRKRVEYDHRLERLYLDKIEGNILAEAYSELAGKWMAERQSVDARLLAIDQATANYRQNSLETLELCTRAHKRFVSGSKEDQRSLFNSMFASASFDGEILTLELRSWFKRVFDLNLADAPLIEWLPILDELRTFVLAA